MFDDNVIEDVELRLCVRVAHAQMNVAAALGRFVVPHADSRLRGYVVDVQRLVERDDRDPFVVLEDVLILKDQLMPLIDEGTHEEWLDFDGDVSGPQVHQLRDQRARDLVKVIDVIENLRVETEDLRAFLRGIRLQGRLLLR